MIKAIAGEAKYKLNGIFFNEQLHMKHKTIPTTDNNSATYIGDHRPSVIRRLMKLGITPTQQRIQIAMFLLKAPQHLSADEILLAVNNAERQVSKATIYNTLNLFVAKGLIRELTVYPGKVVYDSNTTAHYHFYNIDTGELFDMDVDDPGITTPILPDGTRLDSMDVVVRIRNA
ncbi:Fur family transcriptional regulator [Candidatus Venteria ishoeyi]|uniref:Fur family transcriptional regulator n=1 Tax=Candidatus Venteria ishoeyi TaxID=1899563 RepID=UPI0025A568B9|nr:Fur family transcriptional regulator [Candidatus Venteria ishoeyi]MDM8545230.1 Fur family transcriptional regulator [Candidatus Venteria ishoeyi]